MFGSSRPWEEPERTPRRGARESTLVATLVSIAAHAAIAIVGAIGVARGLAHEPVDPAPGDEAHTFPAPNPDEPIIVELPPSMASDDLAPAATIAVAPPVEPPALAGGAKTPMIDTGTAGKGGDPEVSASARNLGPRADDDTVASALRDDVIRDQDNRLDTSDERKSNVDRRMALQPMELTFVASGKGFRYERKPVAAKDAPPGVPTVDKASVLGTALGDGATAGTEGVGDVLAKTAGGATLGASTASPNQGAAYGTPASVGALQLAGAAVAKARPNVDQGKPSVTANDKGQTSDDTDSDQANTALKSLVDTTTFGGAKVGEGKGGVGGGSDPGAGGTGGIGAKSIALGDGPGSLDGPREKRRLAYFGNLQKRLGPLVASAFPREEELELRSGTVIVDLVLGKSGNVVDVVVIRPSGFASFDKNVVDAIRAAAMFEPVPDVLSMTTLTVRVPVQGGWRLH